MLASLLFSLTFKKQSFVVDGVGEWDTTTVWSGIQKKSSQSFKHRIITLLDKYSAFTRYCGFRVI